MNAFLQKDAERMEKVSKRVQQIETVSNNVKLLSEMLAHYQPGNSSESDRDIMKVRPLFSSFAVFIFLVTIEHCSFSNTLLLAGII